MKPRARGMICAMRCWVGSVVGVGVIFCIRKVETIMARGRM